MCIPCVSTVDFVNRIDADCGRFHTVNNRTPSSRSGHSSRSRSKEKSRDSLTREERKETTRRAIVSAALHLLAERSFSGLSLREVTREAGIVPAAFYRHFESMEALGLVLIDESFRSLRDMLRGARAGKLDPNRVIESSVDILIAGCLLYTSPSPRDGLLSRMPSSA